MHCKRNNELILFFNITTLDKPEADTKNPTESVDKNVKEEKVGSDENEGKF